MRDQNRIDTTHPPRTPDLDLQSLQYYDESQPVHADTHSTGLRRDDREGSSWDQQERFLIEANSRAWISLQEFYQTRTQDLRQSLARLERTNLELIQQMTQVNRNAEDCRQSRRNLEDDNTALRSTNTSLENDVSGLQTTNNELVVQFQELVAAHDQEKRQWQAREKRWQVEWKALISQHDRDKKELSDRHQSEKSAIESQHEQEKRDMRTDHEAKTKSLRSENAANKLQLASYNSGSSYVAIADPEFRALFLDIVQRVGNLSTLVPAPEDLESTALRRADPERYLARHADRLNRAWPKFMRSTCWGILMDGFFALPLGFGALGMNGEGHERLGQLRRLLITKSNEDPSLGPDVFTSDKNINIWRATLFEAILGEATRYSHSASSDRDFGALFHANVSSVSRTLKSALEDLTASSLDPRIPSLFHSISRDLGVLALKMGAQRAHVFLEGIRHGAWIESDEKFADEGNSGYAGPMTQVDVMTSPCVRRIGDGREDSRAQSIIAKGSIVGLMVES
ncbi:hypothetical protein PG991_013322 [Apiospora marii]|uniref:Uncharacterized protein n=1 Tax=Apiospora marii TaxID=335849 RepID=A0ABR1R5N3_9PEZI